MSQQKPKPPDPRTLISDTAARELVGGISTMTRTRWMRDPRIGWPEVRAVIRGRRYLSLRDVHALMDRLSAATASGEATTAEPPVLPRHRRPKAGGAVT